MLSLKITVDAVDYYLSDQEHQTIISNQYHVPFLISAPKVSLKATRGGFIQIESGSFVLENRPNDSDHPFSGANFISLVSTPQTFPFVLRYSEINYNLLTGVCSLSAMAGNELRFSMDIDEYDFNLISYVTDLNGNSVVRPFSFGVITHRTPVVQTGALTFANPSLGTSGVTIYENGVALTITSNDSTIITVAAYNGGEVSISGTSTRGTTLEQFFDYVATTIGLDLVTADTTKSPGASGITLSIYENNPRQLLDFASEVAESCNYQFRIWIDTSTGDTTLFLIDRANSPAGATAIDEEDIISNKIAYSLPLKEIRASYEVASAGNGILQRNRQNLVSTQNPAGKKISVDAFADTFAQRATIQARIDAIKAIEKLPVIEFEVPGIATNYEHGDRFTFNRFLDFLSVNMIARGIEFDFKNLTTTISGEATLTAYTQS